VLLWKQKPEKEHLFRRYFRNPIFSSLYEETLSKNRKSSSFFCGKLEKEVSLSQVKSHNRHKLPLRILTILTIYLCYVNFEKVDAVLDEIRYLSMM